MKRVNKNVIRKRTGRKPIGEKAAKVVAMRLPEEIINDVKAYAKEQGIKHQSIAFRRLVERGLAAESPAPRTKEKRNGR